MTPISTPLRLATACAAACAVSAGLLAGCSTSRPFSVRGSVSAADAPADAPSVTTLPAGSAVPAGAVSRATASTAAAKTDSTEVITSEFQAPPAPSPPGRVLPAAGEADSESLTALPLLPADGPAVLPEAPRPASEPHTLSETEAAGSRELPVTPPAVDSLPALEQIALTQNPGLARLQHSYGAALARSKYADQLPDPTVMANVFGNPLETAAGSQRANFTVSQVIPWLSRLNAREQSELLEALAVHAEYRAARLRVVADVRTAWYQLFVSGRQIETTRANQELLESLIKVANARVATGAATQGDVLLGTLELSRLEEQLLTYRQQEVSLKAKLNRLLGRSAATPVASPEELNTELPEWTHPQLVDLAQRHQPEIDAARLRTQASRWGMEVARLSRRPEFMLSSSWFATDDNRPASTVVNVGEDPWNAGIRVSIPLWDQKYDAMEQEAVARHLAAHSSVAEVRDQYDALLRDLWEQARTAAQTATLYEETILPQARQTLDADQQSYANGNVDFERIVRDFRNVLTLELGQHQAIGRLAIALARIEQAVGTEHLLPAR